MNRGTTLFLLLVVLVLGGAVWWQSEREERGDFDYVERLFEGVERGGVTAMRIDNLERSVHAKFERDAGHRWSLTDPIAYPAREEIVTLLLEIIERNTVSRVPDEELEFAEQGLDPPRIVFEVSSASDAGGELKTRVEIGPVDLDGNRVYVRVRDRIWRTARNLDTTLAYHVQDLRSKRVFTVGAHEVTRIQRTGFTFDDTTSRSEALDIVRRDPHWWMSSPERAQVDPYAAGVLAAGAMTLRVGVFEGDAPDDLSVYGLDPPEVTLTLHTSRGRTETLLMSLVKGRWMAKRQDLPWVWELEADDVFRVFMRPEELLDYSLARFLRDQVQRIRLFGPGREVLVSARGDDWTVRDARTEDAPPMRADRARVEALLTALEQLEIADYLFDQGEGAVETHFGAGQARGFELFTGSDSQGGRVGALHRTEAGGEVLYFHRIGESLVSLVPKELGALIDTPLDDLRTLSLFELEEVHLRGLILRSAQAEKQYRREIEGTWRYRDIDAPATELHGVLDALFFLRARRHVAAADAVPLEALQDWVEVELVDYLGKSRTARMGRAPDPADPDGAGRVEVEVDGLRSVLADQALIERLRAILAS